MLKIKNQKLKHKKVLITAGPTWVSIDNVRVISNTATGETGLLLAERLQAKGAKITLVIGPVADCCLNKKIRILRFRYFDELKNLIVKELKRNRFDIVIHSAAVSDYRPRKPYRGKVSSDKKEWVIALKPTGKILDIFKKLNRSSLVIAFKYEPGATKARIIRESRMLIYRRSCDLVVGNTMQGGRYAAYIVGGDAVVGPFANKGSMAINLIKAIT